MNLQRITNPVERDCDKRGCSKPIPAGTKAIKEYKRTGNKYYHTECKKVKRHSQKVVIENSAIALVNLETLGLINITGSGLLGFLKITKPGFKTTPKGNMVALHSRKLFNTEDVCSSELSK